MIITCDLPEDWVLKIGNLLWKGLTMDDSKFTLQWKFVKDIGICIELGGRSLTKTEDGFDCVTNRVLRILWKSGIPLEIKLSKVFSSKELLPLFDKFEFTMLTEAKHLFEAFGDSCTITICKTDSDISLKLGLTGFSLHMRTTNGDLNKILEFFKELYMWHPCDMSSTSSSGIESWEMPIIM